MINTYVPFIGHEEQKNLKNSIKQNYISTFGPTVEKFENTFSKIFNFKYTVALNSGTSALHAALIASNIKANDVVIVPSYTFAATANAITYVGAIPWFFDCAKDLILDLDKLSNILKKKTKIVNKKLILKENGKVVKCIIPVQTFGQNIEFKKFEDFAKKNFLKIIFDSAACHDPKIFKFKKSLSSSYCFSFNGNKTLTTGAGGIFATNSLTLANKVKVLSSVGKKMTKYDYHVIGYNYKMTNLQASIGLAQLKKLDLIIKKKKKLFNFYKNNLKLNKSSKIIFSNNFVNWVFGIIVKGDYQFNKIKEILNKNNIQLTYFWKPLHLQKPYKKFMKEKNLYCTNIWKKIVILPSHPGINISEQKKICKLVNKYL